ncbi:hypothetical protein [Microbacterium sp. NPDC055455]
MPNPTELTEKTRIYDFGTHSVTLTDVRELIVSASGNHRIRTGDGNLHIIAPGWFAVHIDDGGKGWTV